MTIKLARRLMAVALTLSLSGTAWSQGNARQLFFDGYELLSSGKPKEAIPKFEAGLRLEPNNAAARFYFGEALLAIGQRDKAKEQLRKSVELDPNSDVSADARKRLGELSGNAFAEGKGSTAGAGGNLPAPGTVIQDCPVCPEVVVVPAGQFVMGSPPSETGRDDDEGPPHIVTIAKPFAVGKYEVTFEEWDACVRDKGCGAAEDSGWGRGRRPVINVNYEQAVGYAEWLSDKTGRKYRLLSESEWEYAARAGSEKPRFWGTSSDRACEFANVANPSTTSESWWKKKWIPHSCEDGYPAQTAPVGKFKANAFGLHDMLGNVWEWVEDCYNQSYDGAPNDGRTWATGDCSLRVIRGGSWSYKPALARSAERSGIQPAERGSYLGFRIARTLP